MRWISRRGSRISFVPPKIGQQNWKIGSQELEAEVQLYREKSERAEQWLGKISNEIQERVMGAIIEANETRLRGMPRPAIKLKLISHADNRRI